MSMKPSPTQDQDSCELHVNLLNGSDTQELQKSEKVLEEEHSN